MLLPLAFADARVRTLAERALDRCVNPECGVDAPDGQAVAIVALRPLPTGQVLGDELDNGLWLCARCAAAVAAARERLPGRLLRAWAAEAEAWAARRRPPLPEVRVRPVREAGGGVHELVVGNRDERLPIEVVLEWQWPEAVDPSDAPAEEAGGTALAPVHVGPREFATRARLAAGQRVAARLRSAATPAVAELLAPGRREARALFGRGVAHFELAGRPRRRTFVVPLDYDDRTRELTSIAVDDDVATWSLRDRRTI